MSFVHCTKSNLSEQCNRNLTKIQPESFRKPIKPVSIQLADHLFQFVLLEGFFHDAQTKNHNIKERNFKHFNEREFLEAIHNINIDDVLCFDYKDPNISIENFYNNINYILDEFAPFKKLNKNDIKLKGKPWINKEVQYLMWKRDKLF